MSRKNRAETFTGSPCRRGGHTLRYASNGSCVVCHKAEAAKWGDANRAKRREIANRYYRTNTSRAKAANAKWKKANPDKRKDAELRREFGISLAQYREMLQKQGGVCALCECVCRTGNSLAVDHDHRTGKVRGLLCFRCNLALERADAHPTWLQSAGQYLRGAA